MNEFKYACKQEEIPLGKAKNVNLEGVEIAIFHTEEGFLARSGVCKHNAFKLEFCEITGDIARCPLHGWQYRISSGRGIKPGWTQLESYPVELRGNEIWVMPVEDDSKEDEFDTSAYQW